MASRLWLAYVAVAAMAVVVYVVSASDVVKTAVVIPLAAAVPIAVALSLRLRAPAHRLPWVLLGVMHLGWALAWVFWQRSIIVEGVVPAPGSPENMLFLLAELLQIVILLLLLRRVDRGTPSLLDTAIVVAALLTVAWPALIHRYVEAETMSALGRGVQISFALVDIAILALAARIFATARRPPPAVLFLLASAAGLLVSDATWNWSTALGEYSPGSWADVGWMLFHVFAAAAALHPSMRDAYASAPASARRFGWGRLALLVVAALVPPFVLVNIDSATEDPLRTVPSAVAAAVLVALVVVRMGLTVRDEARLSARLNEQNERLREVDRLKDDFVASVSHELRTPLTSIRGYVELMSEGQAGELTPEQAKYLDVVERNADRLLRVVTDLLFVAQMDAERIALEVKSVDLAALAAQTLEAARPAANRKGVALAFEDGEVQEVRGDPLRLSQLLDNLVSNAIKFTPSGGRVEVRTAVHGARAVVEVADSGVGIPPEDLPHLFDRFYRAHDATATGTPGTGLGLAIAKRIAEAHGGTISVVSERGAGTTFRAELPLVSTAPAPAGQPPEAVAT